MKGAPLAVLATPVAEVSSIAALTMAYRLKLANFRKSAFLRSVGVLVGGTAFAQALMILLLPLLTRLYTPEDFSVLAVYVSLLGIISVAACLRFDVAIPLPEGDEDAANLLGLALACSFAISVLAGTLVLAFPEVITHLIGQPRLKPYLWLIPLGVLLASSYSALQFWAVRKKAFHAVARTKMTQAIGGVGIQAALGWVGLAPFGLLFGQMINSGAGILGLGLRAFKGDRNTMRAISLPRMRSAFSEYHRFPKYSVVESVANSAGIQLPVILIASLAVGPEAGFLMLAMRAMQAPMGLIGTAVSQVYLSRAPSEYRAGVLGPFTARMIGGLMKTGVGPLIFAGVIAPVVFPIIFGEKWFRAGELVAWMTPWFVMQFLVSPVSMTLYVTGNQKTALVLQLCGLVLRVGAVVLAAAFTPAYIVEVYAMSGFVFYAAYFIAVAVSASIKTNALLHEAKKSAGVVIAWIAASIMARYIVAMLVVK